MFRKVEDFTKSWPHHRNSVINLLKQLTDASLHQAVCAGHRTIDRLCWHIIATIPEMMARTGLLIHFDGKWEKMPDSLSAANIVDLYTQVSDELIKQIELNWNDDTLLVADDMYGEQWQRGLTLTILISHEIHHLGQLTVLMRQAGLPVPGLYGPSKEEWTQYNAPAPEV